MVELVVGFIKELDVWFPKQLALDVMGVFYFQHWLQAYAYSTFPQHLEVLKALYYTPRPCGVAVDGKSTLMVLVILLA